MFNLIFGSTELTVWDRFMLRMFFNLFAFMVFAIFIKVVCD